MPYLLKTFSEKHFNELNRENYDIDYIDLNNENIIILLLKPGSIITRPQTRASVNMGELVQYIIHYQDEEDKSITQLLTNEYNVKLTKDNLDTMKEEYLKMIAFTYEDTNFIERYNELIEKYCDEYIRTLQIYGAEVGSGTLEMDIPTKKEGSIRIFAQTFISFKEHYKNTEHKTPSWSFDIYKIYKLCSYKLNIKYLIEGVVPEKNKAILISVWEQHKDEMGNPTKILRGIRVTELGGFDKNPMGVYLCSLNMGKFLQTHTEQLICAISEYVHGELEQQKITEQRGKPKIYELYAIEDAVGFWEYMGFTKTTNRTKVGDIETLTFKTRKTGDKINYHMTKPICI